MVGLQGVAKAVDNLMPVGTAKVQGAQNTPFGGVLKSVME